MEGKGPQNVHPIISLSLWAMISCPTCLSMYVFAYLRAPCWHRHDTSSERSLRYCRPSENGRHYYCNVTVMFSHWWMRHEVIWKLPSTMSLIVSLVSLWSACAHLCVLEEPWLWRAVATKSATLPFKGLLHPKMKMLSLITYPHVVPNP